MTTPTPEAAIDAVRAQRHAVAAAQAAFDDTLTPEQIAACAELEAAQAELDALVEVAREAVLTAGASPSTAFVLSTRVEVKAANPAALPAEHLTVKASAAKLVGTPEAEAAGLTVTEKPTVSYYPARL